ncbi:MAG TPA: 8-amino-7-oxononanoate synthase [Vicinamibacteria bacterium]
MTTLEEYRAELREQLGALDASGLRRHLREPAGLDLCSNDFLGLCRHPHLIESMCAALPGLGSGATGSRLLSGQRRAFADLEERLAAFSGREAAVLFGSGFAANLGLLQTMVRTGDLVLSDARNHASLIDGLRLVRGVKKVVYRHQDLDAVEQALRLPRGEARAFVLTESVFGMDGDLTPLGELSDLCDAHGGLLVVDEAHATGLYGASGSGRVEELGLRERVLATVHTGGKALGSGGAWVAGPRELIDHLVNRARTFVFSTAPLPVLAPALSAGLDVVAREPERRAEVHRKAALLRQALGDAGLKPGGASAVIPVIVGANEAALQLQDELLAQGYDVRAVRPPTVPEGTARLRVTARYPVADDDLVRFAGAAARLLHATAVTA